MSFFDKIKHGFRKFMTGRRGGDELSLALLIAGLVASLISSIFGSSLLYIVGTALYIACLFRMFSKNLTKRYEENRKYIEWRQKVKTSISQAKVRLKNMRKYKYFKCPECKALLKLPRKVGEVTVTCGKCHHQFKKKA